MFQDPLYLKYSTLVLITLQTTTMVLVLRYSRKANDGEAYINSTAVFLSEVLKIFICSFAIIFKDSLHAFYKVLRYEIIGKPKELLQIFVPAFLYTIQNNLLFIALSNLDAATYQVTYQFKILTTALFATTLLHKRLSVRQWLSLLILMIGVILVQWQSQGGSKTTKDVRNESEDRLIGLLAVLLSSFSSGFSGVYLEKLIKHTPQSLWTRNTQLAITSCFLSFVTILVHDYDHVAQKGFFFAYNRYTWFVILLQAFGGICVSLVMKYADNILKGFATTISIILSSLCSYYIFHDFFPNNMFSIGALLVIVSTFLYSL